MYPTIASIMTPKPRKAAEDSEQPYPESPVVEIIDHGQDFVTIEWESTDYTDLYRIFRAEGNGGYVQLGEDIPDNQSSYQFTDDTVKPDTRYRYRVYAVNETGGGNSNTVEITIEPSYEPETTAFLETIELPDDNNDSIYTGRTNNDIWVGVDDFLKTIAPIKEKVISVYPYIGGTAEKHRYNLMNPSVGIIDWYGSWVHNALGVKGNGSNTYGNANIQQKGTVQDYSESIGSYITMEGNTGTDIGNHGSNTPRASYVNSGRGNGGKIGVRFQSTTYLESSFDAGHHKGFNAISRIDRDGFSFYNNTQESYVENIADTEPLHETNYFIGSTYSDGFESSKGYGTSFIAHGLTPSEMTLFREAVEELQTVLNRNYESL